MPCVTNEGIRINYEKCPEPYTREEVLEERFGELLKGMAFDDEIMEWVSPALRESHQDECVLSRAGDR
jgi:hypothetical protein